MPDTVSSPSRLSAPYRGTATATLLLLAAAYPALAQDAQTAEEAAPPEDVVAALESAARGTPFEDDLHPDTAKTGRALSPLQAAFDVRHYALDLKVMPSTRSIEGTLSATFEATESLDASPWISTRA